MSDMLVEDQAWICSDCLSLHASGDLSSFFHFYGSEAAVKEAEHRAMVATHLSGYRLTLGWLYEQHGCKYNHTVTLTRNGQSTTEDVYGDSTDYLDDVLSKARILPHVLEDGDVVTIERHELMTVSGAGGECDCETNPYREGECASCGQYLAGEFHAATIWGVKPWARRLFSQSSRPHSLNR